MRRAALTALALAASSSVVVHSAAQLGPPLPSLPTLPRIRVDVARDHVMATEEVNLGRGSWAGGDLDLFVAFGAPGTPRAVDAKLYALGETAQNPPGDAVGESVDIQLAPRRPAGAYLLLGSPLMAGFVVHVREAAFRRAVAGGGFARLRLRSLLEGPALDGSGSREVVLRLGIAGGPPITLGELQLAGALRAEAHLCGPEADPYPVAVTIFPPPSHPPPPTWPGPAAAALTVRHASDDLCVRFWGP